MKKTLSMILAALMVAGAAATTAVASDEEVLLSDHAKVIYGGDIESGSPEAIFDGDITTGVRMAAQGEGNWVGIELDAPALLTYVRFSGVDNDGDGKIDPPWYIHGSSVMGSNDGENWEYILTFGDPYWEYDEYAYDLEVACTTTFATEYAFDGEEDEDVDAMDPVEYKYFMVYNDAKGWPAWGEVEFWGVLSEVAPEEPDYILGDLNMDENVDIADAVLLFQHSMVPDLYPIEYAGDIDFNVDGTVDIADAVLLFQHSMVPDLYPIG